MATKKKSLNAAQRRTSARAAARLDKMASTMATTNPIEAFRAGQPDTAYAAIDALDAARVLPRQVQRDLATASGLALFGRGRPVDKASTLAASQRLSDDLGAAYIDALGGPLTAKDAAVIARLTGTGMTRAAQRAIMGLD